MVLDTFRRWFNIYNVIRMWSQFEIIHSLKIHCVHSYSKDYYFHFTTIRIVWLVIMTSRGFWTKNCMKLDIFVPNHTSSARCHFPSAGEKICVFECSFEMLSCTMNVYNISQHIKYRGYFVLTITHNLRFTWHNSLLSDC